MDEVVKYSLRFTGDMEGLTRRGYTYVRDGNAHYEKDKFWIYPDGDVSLFYLDGHSGALLSYLMDQDFVWQMDSVDVGKVPYRLMLDMWTGEVMNVDRENEMAILLAKDEATREELVLKYDTERFIRLTYSFNESIVKELFEMYHSGELLLTEALPVEEVHREDLDIPKKYELYFTGSNETLLDLGYTRYGDYVDYGGTFTRGNICIEEDDGYTSFFSMGAYSGAVLAYLIERDFVWQGSGQFGLVPQRIMVDVGTGDVVDFVEGYDVNRYVKVYFEFNEEWIASIENLYHTGELELSDY